MIWLAPLLVVLCPFFLALGLVLPLVRFDSFFFFSDTPSLIGVLAALWQSQDYALCLIVALFSVVFPLLKMIAAAWLLYDIAAPSRFSRTASRLLPLLSKWSMMDVLLVALLVVAAKTSGVASALTQPGLWFYAASAVLSSLLQSMGRPRKNPPPPQRELV